MSWTQFLKLHWDVLAATDFFTVEVATWHGLVTYYVLVVMELATRRVQIAGMTPHPTAAFMQQCARQLTDPFDGFLLGKRSLIHDRDTTFGISPRAHQQQHEQGTRCRSPWLRHEVTRLREAIPSRNRCNTGVRRGTRPMDPARSAIRSRMAAPANHGNSRRRLQHRRVLSQPVGGGHRVQKGQARASGINPKRRRDVRPLAGTQPRDGAEHARTHARFT